MAPRPEGAEVAYIGIGSNLRDPLRQVHKALRALAELPVSRLLEQSSCYRTTPLGPPGQSDYVNAAALLETELGPLELLDALQAVERSHGRSRGGKRWGPRTLDLDLLLYGGRTMASERLRLPHPEMHRRGFVLVPLADIAPATLPIPGAGRLQELLLACDNTGIVPLD